MSAKIHARRQRLARQCDPPALRDCALQAASSEGVASRYTSTPASDGVGAVGPIISAPPTPSASML